MSPQSSNSYRSRSPTLSLAQGSLYEDGEIREPRVRVMSMENAEVANGEDAQDAQDVEVDFEEIDIDDLPDFNLEF
jgi:hypothetical protein